VASQPLRAKEAPQGLVNGSSYAVIDHEYDVGDALETLSSWYKLIIGIGSRGGRWRRGSESSFWPCGGRIQHGLRDETLPDQKSYGGGAGWHQCRSRKVSGSYLE
jgi:hypothetical protein